MVKQACTVRPSYRKFIIAHISRLQATAPLITSGHTTDNKASRTTHTQARQLRFTRDTF